MEIALSADELVSAMLRLSQTETVCMLDSCGVGHQGSRFLIAGFEPVRVLENSGQNVSKDLKILDEALSSPDLASIFTLSYEFGMKIQGIDPDLSFEYRSKEPDLFLAQFFVLVVHDYDEDTTTMVGDISRFSKLFDRLKANITIQESYSDDLALTVSSNFYDRSYISAIDEIHELIRAGETYQTNLTQQLSVELTGDITPQKIFWRLRRENPAPFAAFLTRSTSTVVSASPERFFSVTDNGNRIVTSPIKGTRPRGSTPDEDKKLKIELLSSSKDISENTMIVDLLRNDLGRVCEYGSVVVDDLCRLEEHPTLFHLVSTISGKLRYGIKHSEILRALFPCGSITGAPKISTMKIINRIETRPRGLSMGAIGYYVPGAVDPTRSNNFATSVLASRLDLSVAIRTMVIEDQIAVFNVGGGIVIDSDPMAEYRESMTKAKALLSAVGATTK